MEWRDVISAVAAISGIILGWFVATKNGKREIKQEVKEETEASVVLRTDMEYLKRGIDDIRFDIRKQGERLDGQAERLTRLEESAKQAHKRIDKLENENVKG